MIYRSNIFIVVSKDILTIEAFCEPDIEKFYSFTNGRYFAYIIDFNFLVSKKEVVDSLSKDNLKGILELIPVHTLYDVLEYLEEFLVG